MPLRALPALAAVALCLGCGGGDSESSSDGVPAGDAPTTPGVLVEDDFSDPASGWTENDDAEALLAYADGGYRILLKAPPPGDARFRLFRA